MATEEQKNANNNNLESINFLQKKNEINEVR